jgi:hypothetical protein
MLSDDVYLSRLRGTTSILEAWAHAVRVHALVDVGHDEASWRLSVLPHARQACPFELMLRNDQRFDLTVGAETFEDLPITSLEIFGPLLEAIAAGNVAISSVSTVATGMNIGVETVITPVDLAPWIGLRAVAPAAFQITNIPVVRSERRFAPYARGP